MSKLGKIDGLVIGALLGVVLAFPGIGTTITNWITSIVPITWDFLGTYTVKAIIIAGAALIGAITDWTK